MSSRRRANTVRPYGGEALCHSEEGKRLVRMNDGLDGGAQLVNGKWSVGYLFWLYERKYADYLLLQETN